MNDAEPLPEGYLLGSTVELTTDRTKMARYLRIKGMFLAALANETRTAIVIYWKPTHAALLTTTKPTTVPVVKACATHAPRLRRYRLATAGDLAAYAMSDAPATLPGRLNLVIALGTCLTAQNGELAHPALLMKDGISTLFTVKCWITNGLYGPCTFLLVR